MKDLRDSLGRRYTASQHCMKQAMDRMWQGRMEEGLAMLRSYLAEHPQEAAVHTMLNFFTHYALGVERETLFAMHKEWGRRHAPVKLALREHDNDPNPKRRLRIGYVSPDFYSHAVTFAFENLLLQRDCENFEVFGYGSVNKPDATTERLRQSFDHYYDVLHLSDEQLAQRIREDRIDILVNIAGLVAGHRLGAFAYKPAPIQIDFQGVDTTGLTQMDYRLTDAVLDPPGSEAFHVEELVRLPRSLACYAPPQPCPEVGPLPYERNGFITFGSFNVGLKLNVSVVALWSRVLHACPEAHLLLKVNTEDENLLQQYRAWFIEQGIAPERIEVFPRIVSDWDHFNLYNRVDIALDTHPFNGGITTLDSLWMGLPVISLVGDRFVSRMGHTILSHAGQEEWVVHSEEDFITRAVRLAQDPENLAQIRTALRTHLQNSSICDARDFIASIEQVYRSVWQRWCEDTGTSVVSIPAADLLEQTAQNAQAAFVAGNTDRALSLYLEALERGLEHPTAFQTLGELYLYRRDFSQALPWLQRAAAEVCTPERLERLTMAHLGLGQLDAAYKTIREQGGAGETTPLAHAVEILGPDWHQDASSLPTELVAPCRTLADWYFDNQRWDEAELAYTKILATSPQGLVHARLAHIYRFTGRFFAALEQLQAAFDLEPENATYRGAYAHTQLLTGDIEAGIAGLEAAIDLAPDNAELASSYLFAANYQLQTKPETLARQHRQWGQRFGPLSLMLAGIDRPYDPERSLRIGYLGADFKRHSVGYTLEGILRAHDHAAFEIFAYGSVGQADEVTTRLKRLCDHYRDIQPLDDVTVARLIRDDGIDILVAVAGHSYGNRLGVLAYKPAPIQVDYGGIHTTGLSQVDYRITDENRDPPETQGYFQERFVYLPAGSTCYTPPVEAPPVSPLPAETNGFITFGACHNTQKLNPEVLALWGRVLHSVPAARLLMKCPGGELPELQARLRAGVVRGGGSEERITVIGLRPEGEHLAFYHDVDIALDAFPFNGGVTTLEGLWMGVPIITMVGNRPVARTGLSLLAQLDMKAFAVDSAERYVKLAVALAANTNALTQIRATLRQRMLASTLCHHATYVKHLEDAYRQIWRWACASVTSGTQVPVGGQTV